MMDEELAHAGFEMFKEVEELARSKSLNPQSDESKKSKPSPRKEKNSPTENSTQKRGNLKQADLVKWTVFVRPEVKVAVQKAAKKAGVTDTAWLDEKLWEGAKSDLTKKAQPPAKPEDVADIINKVADRMKADQEAATKAQNALIEQQGAQIADLKQTIQDVVNRPQPSLVERIFGKSGKGKTSD